MAPLNFAALKAKAADAAGDLKNKSTSKPVQYKPVTPWDSDAERRPTASERFQQSTVLQHHAAIHRPPPPPKRIVGLGAATSEDPIDAATPVAAPPHLPYRNSSTSSPAPPSLPARKPSSPAFGSTIAPPPPPPRNNLNSGSGSSNTRVVPTPPVPAPSYQHAINNDLPKPVTAVPSAPAPPPRSVPGVPAAAIALSQSGSAQRGGFVRFSDYGTAEKEELFAVLDEFFEARLSALQLGEEITSASEYLSPDPITTSAPPRAAISPLPNVHAPPPVSISTRPAATPSSSSLPSYPPPQTHSSSALSLCHWILYETFTSHWYNDSSSSLPPPIQGRNDMRYSGSWMTSGTKKTVIGFALFGDASCAWWSISFDSRSPNQAHREARYRPIPSPWSGERLYAASEIYASKIVAFANQALASGRPVARGECWDMAAEALNHVNRPGAEEPFPSIGRTHGHLIYYGRAGDRGWWRGGDAYVRPGDIVEWRLVTIRQVGSPHGSYSTLGDPDHTAVIIDVGPPKVTPTDGDEFGVEQLADLTVVEQSQGKAPSMAIYDLSSMSKGEVWIYRPVPLIDLVGTEIKGEWPPKCETWEVGQLE